MTKPEVGQSTGFNEPVDFAPVLLIAIEEMGDQVVTNPAIHFGVETFVPAEGFEPTKPFLTRLSWRDLDGNTQSKLLLSAPEIVLATAVTGTSKDLAPSPAPRGGGGRKPTATIDRRRARRRAPEPA